MTGQCLHLGVAALLDGTTWHGVVATYPLFFLLIVVHCGLFWQASKGLATSGGHVHRESTAGKVRLAPYLPFQGLA